jgi:hypothetical protein
VSGNHDLAAIFLVALSFCSFIAVAGLSNQDDSLENQNMTRVIKPDNASTELVQIPTGALIDDYVSQSELRLGPKYTIIKVGGVYQVLSNQGVLSSSLASFEASLDVALAGLTVGRVMPETIFVDGNVTIDSTLKIPSQVDLVGNGVWTAANGLNSNLIENADPTVNNDHIFLRGYPFLKIDGNFAGQGARSDGVKFVNANNVGLTYGTGRQYVIQNLLITGCNGIGATFDFTGSNESTFDILNCRIFTNVGAAFAKALYLHNVVDSDIIEGSFDGGNSDPMYTIFIDGGSFISITDSYINQGCYFTGVQHSKISPQVIDQNTDMPALIMKNCKYNSVFHTKIRVNANSATATLEGIQLVTDGGGGNDSTNNVFSDITFGQMGAGGTRTWKYGITEGDANQDSNQYVNINGLECSTATLVLKGAASKGQHQNILGTVTEA